MVGNDIIDLKKATVESNWQREGFLNKIFTNNEQNSIHDSVDPFLLVWRLWSMKESVYKVFIQKGGQRAFNPSKIDCRVINENVGYVIMANERFEVSSTLNSEYIYSQTISHDLNTITRIFKIENDDYSVVKTGLLTYVSNIYNFHLDKLEINKNDDNVPFLKYKNEKIKASISITHHGSFGAFSINNIEL